MRDSRRSVPALAILLAMFITTGQARAQDAEEQLFQRLSDTTLENILKKRKIPFERKVIEIQGTKSPHYFVMIGKFGAVIVNDGTSILALSNGFRTKTGEAVSLERMNEWNIKSRRFGRASLISSGEAVIQAELDFGGGTNQKIITAWITRFSTSVGEFVEFVK